MSKIDLNNISHSYNQNDTNPVYAFNEIGVLVSSPFGGSYV